jgi:hypothetical protein
MTPRDRPDRISEGEQDEPERDGHAELADGLNTEDRGADGEEHKDESSDRFSERLAGDIRSRNGAGHEYPDSWGRQLRGPIAVILAALVRAPGDRRSPL